MRQVKRKTMAAARNRSAANTKATSKPQPPQMLHTGISQLLEQTPRTEAEKDAYIRELQSTLKDVMSENIDLQELLALLRRQMYGSKSEKTPVKEESPQLGMFNEAEQEYAGTVEEPVKKDQRGWHIKDGKGRWKLQKTKDIPVKERILSLEGEDLKCPDCGHVMECIGKTVVREEPVFIPARIELIQYIQPSYCCPHCKKQGKVTICKPMAPRPLLNHSMASASVVAQVMYEKYVQAVPLYRQEAQWAEAGLQFTRTTMANWMIRCSEDWLSLIYEHLRKELLRRKVLHADETPVQVLKEPGKSAASKSYMWVYRTGADGKSPVILYEYQPGRSGEYPKTFLEGFSGYLHTDGYAGYNKLEGVTRCGCWAHVRRKFVEAMPAEHLRAVVPSGAAQTGRDYCDQLFRAEKELALLPAKKKQQARFEQEGPMLRAFWCWLDEMSQQPLGGKLKKAVEYAQGQRPYLENYLKDPACQISNNLAENAIRPFTVGRKNWLFSNSVAGAKASAVIYSLVETAKANNLSPRDYLEILLENLPNMDARQHPEELDELMPWGGFIRSRFGLDEKD